MKSLIVSMALWPNRNLHFQRHKVWQLGALLLLLGQLLNPLSASAANYIDKEVAPESELSVLVKPLLHTLNSGDRQRILAFAKRHFSTSFMPAGSEVEIVNYLMSLHYGYGPLRFHGFRHYQPAFPDELLVVVYSELTESWQMIGLVNDGTQRDKIGNFLLAPARWPSNVPAPAALDEASAVAKLNRFAERLAQDEHFSGTLLLAKGDKVLINRSFGLANKASEIKNNTETRFDLASITKVFTGVAVTQLIQANKLRPTDTLDLYLDQSWLPSEISKTIQIQHLLTHTSGLAGYDDALRQANKAQLVRLQDYRPLLNIDSTLFEPGSQQMYSNTGMFLLGAVIEKITGQDYHDYIQAHIFDVADMKNSGFLERNQPYKHVAVGYERDDSKKTGWFDNSRVFGLRGTPDGGAYATTADMHKFTLALASHKLLDLAHTRLALSPKPELQAPTYGFGVNILGEGKTHRIGHEGGHYGVSTAFNWYPEPNYTLVVLSNISQGALGLENKARELIERIE